MLSRFALNLARNTNCLAKSPGLNQGTLFKNQCGKNSQCFKALFQSQCSRLTTLSKSAVTKQNVSKLLSSFRRSTTLAQSAAVARTFPDITPFAQKAVGVWLAIVTTMVYGAVLIGGLTRLTESGLSITTWDPITGIKPPRTPEEWDHAFDLYKASPEYRYLERDLDMNSFKFIYYMEWGHRNWGRLIGTVFLLPALYFAKKGYFAQAMKKRIVGYGGLLGLQAVFGIVMVQSGLDEDPHSDEMPRVSQYRLAVHLGTALFLFVNMSWATLMHLLPPVSAHSLNAVNFVHNNRVARLAKLSHTTLGLVFFTAVSGAFVAGLDAGLVYNSWPKFADRWIPSDIAALAPTWRNVFENHTTVQFNHRHLGEFTGTLIFAMWALSKGVRLPYRTRLAVNALGGVALLQVMLGIQTLVHYVPIWLAALHQSNSVFLLATAVWAAQELKRLPK